MNTSTNFLDTNSHYSILRWEPVAGSGECINVAVVCEHSGKYVARTLVRDDVLRCMYGAAGDGVMRMVQGVTDALYRIANNNGLSAAIAAVPLSNFSLSEPIATWVFSFVRSYP